MRMTEEERDGVSLTGSIVAVLAVLAPFSFTSLSLSPSLSIVSMLLLLSSSVAATGSTMDCKDGAGATGAASPFVTYLSISYTLILRRGERVLRKSFLM
jgi:hypothetical protein